MRQGANDPRAHPPATANTSSHARGIGPKNGLGASSCGRRPTAPNNDSVQHIPRTWFITRKARNQTAHATYGNTTPLPGEDWRITLKSCIETSTLDQKPGAVPRCLWQHVLEQTAASIVSTEGTERALGEGSASRLEPTPSGVHRALREIKIHHERQAQRNLPSHFSDYEEADRLQILVLGGTMSNAQRI